MDTVKQATTGAAGKPNSFRWMQLVVGVVCMAMIANLQYGWTLFVNPIDDKHGWGRAAIQVAFTIFVADRDLARADRGLVRRPLRPAHRRRCSAALLVRLAWVMNSYADSLPMLYLAAAIGGIGAGAVYGTCVGNALKWFPDRRGLAAGLTAAGFGAGSALTVVPIADMIKSQRLRGGVPLVRHRPGR